MATLHPKGIPIFELDGDKRAAGSARITDIAKHGNRPSDGLPVLSCACCTCHLGQSKNTAIIHLILQKGAGVEFAYTFNLPSKIRAMFQMTG